MPKPKTKQTHNFAEMLAEIGMGMVVPSEKIIELLRDDEVMKKQRKDHREKHDRDNAANQDAAFGEP